MSFRLIIRILFGLLVFLGVIFQSPPNYVDLGSNHLGVFNPGHILGTDRLGRDNFSLFAYGSLSTILVVLPARILTVLFAFLFASLSQFSNQLTESFLSALSSVFLAIPSLLVALVVITFLPEWKLSVIIAIVVSDWALVYETILSKMRELKNSGYIVSSKLMGASSLQIVYFHYFPALKSLFAFLFLSGLPAVVMTTALFSYLGVQVTLGDFGPGLGEQISFSKDYFDQSPVSVLLPMLAILALVYSLGNDSK
ncbi:ABC transporter permease subunit [Leptospira sp. 96542]|nr:ABC transporter permease subunit [Leptospira sp. 96542]